MVNISWGMLRQLLIIPSSMWKIQKGHFFTTKKLKRAPLIWPPSVFIASLQLFWLKKFLKKISLWGQRPEVRLSFSLEYLQEVKLLQQQQPRSTCSHTRCSIYPPLRECFKTKKLTCFTHFLLCPKISLGSKMTKNGFHVIYLLKPHGKMTNPTQFLPHPKIGSGP